MTATTGPKPDLGVALLEVAAGLPDGEAHQGGGPPVGPVVRPGEPAVTLGRGHYRMCGLPKTALTLGSKWARGSVG